MGEAIEALLELSTPTADIHRFFLGLHGFGAFAAANAAMLVGRYDCQPFDSETVRHMREFHGYDPRFRQTSAQVLEHARKHYSSERYGCWQFAVYWYEYWLTEEQAIARAAQQAAELPASSSSAEGSSPSPSPASKEKKHWQLVAAQTRKRKSGDHDRPRSSRKASSATRLSSSSVVLEEEVEEAVTTSASSSTSARAAAGKSSGTTSLLSVSMRVTRSQRTKLTSAAAAELRFESL